MKKSGLILVSAVLFSACEDSWDSDARALFHQACMETAKESRMDEAAAKSMCDCRLEKTIKRYPNFANAMRHVDSIMIDPDIRACK